MAGGTGRWQRGAGRTEVPVSPKTEAAAGMPTRARSAQRPPCWKTRTHLPTGLRGGNANPAKAGRRTCATRASWRPTPLGPSKGADAPPWVCPFLSAKLIRNLCRSAFPPHFFFFSSDPRTEPRNPKTELQALELVHHRRRRSDVDLGHKRLPTVVRDSSRARPERLCDSLQSTQDYSSQSSKVLNVPP